MRKRFLFLVPLILLVSCSTPKIPDSKPSEPVSVSTPDQDQGELDSGRKYQAYATYYFSKKVSSSSFGIPIRSMSEEVIGPRLTSNDWCLAAVEGTVEVDGKIFNYAGTRNPKQANCKHRPSSYVRWKESPHPYGVGNKGNALEPFKTIACDQGNVAKSKRWLDGGYMKFGQRVYVPLARGALLPSGKKHNGIFICGDVGGAITGNHFDVFVGSSRNDAEAIKNSPFPFMNNKKPFDFYLVE